MGARPYSRRSLDERLNAACDVDVGRSEQVEILGVAVVEVEARQCSPAREKEPVRAFEKGVEESGERWPSDEAMSATSCEDRADIRHLLSEDATHERDVRRAELHSHIHGRTEKEDGDRPRRNIELMSYRCVDRSRSLANPHGMLDDGADGVILGRSGGTHSLSLELDAAVVFGT